MNKTFIASPLIACLILLLPAARAEGPDQATRKFIEEMNIQQAQQPIRDWPRWKKPDRIVMLVSPFDLQARPDLLDWIREVTGDVELITLEGGFGAAPSPDILKTAEVFLGYCSPAIVRQAPNLRWLQNYGVGVDYCVMQEDVRERDLLMTNNQHYSAPPIAEHVIAMMMMLTRNLTGFHRAQLEHKWIRGFTSDAPMIEVKDKTMLIAGLGGIGTEVARRAHGLGMRIIATRNTDRTGPEFVDYVGLADELHELAAQADVIVNALPLTDKTTGIFNAGFFGVLKPGSYFISVGRGGSTVTADLVAALRQGTLAGAGLDVTDPEPLPAEHELWDIPNVIITPHNSSSSDRANERRWIVVRENLRRYINGEPMLNVVDMRRGY